MVYTGPMGKLWDYAVREAKKRASETIEARKVVEALRRYLGQ